MHRQLPLQGGGEPGTSNTCLYHHCEELVVFVQWIAVRVLLAHHYVQWRDEKVGVDDRHVSQKTYVTVDEEYEGAPLSYFQW